MNIFRQGDVLLAKLASMKHVHAATFCVALLEATISPVLPEAFVLLVLAYRNDISWKLLSVTSSLGSSFGALCMYLLGKMFYASYGATLIHVLHGESVLAYAQELFVKNAFAAQFFAALTPLPDRVFSFLAGSFQAPIIAVFVATFVARLIRVMPFAYCSHVYGESARIYLKRHTRTGVYIVAAFVVVYSLYTYFG